MSGARTHAEAIAALRAALRGASIALPHLAGIAAGVRPEAADWVATAAIFASGRLVVAPHWFCNLSVEDRVFVAAHELLHVALRTHERACGSEGKLFNIAHDYIINDMLVEALGQPVPANGLEWRGAWALPAERIVADLRARGENPGTAWQQPKLGALGDALVRAGLAASSRSPASPRSIVDRLVERGETLDVLGQEAERALYPDEADQLGRRISAMAAAGDAALTIGALRERLENAFTPPSSVPRQGERQMYDALDLRLRPSWEIALQRWIDTQAPGTRSYSRASRRQGLRADVVLPGHRREGWTLNVVLDTSGSMTELLPIVLGLLRSFCEAAGVEAVRVIQCGEILESDEIVAVADLARLEIRGGMDGDLKPGMQRLAEDPEVEAALVITDGWEDIPSKAPPFEVLWAITGPVDRFEPGYGRIVELPLEPLIEQRMNEPGRL